MHRGDRCLNPVFHTSAVKCIRSAIAALELLQPTCTLRGSTMSMLSLGLVSKREFVVLLLPLTHTHIHTPRLLQGHQPSLSCSGRVMEREMDRRMQKERVERNGRWCAPLHSVSLTCFSVRLLCSSGCIALLNLMTFYLVPPNPSFATLPQFSTIYSQHLYKMYHI